MKKLLTIVLITILSISWTLAYAPSTKDDKILNKVYKKLNVVCKKSKQKCWNLKNKIDKINIKYKSKPRIHFLLQSISNYIKIQLEVEEDILQNLLEDDIKEPKKVIVPKIIVTKITDWDTIHFKKEWKDYVTRLIWIDSPENSTTRYGHTEKLWNQAKDYLSKIIADKEIQIEYDDTQAKTDKYWRHLVYIFYKWENINQKMIEKWLAKEYTYDRPYKYQKEFIAAEKEAKKLKKWLWGLENKEEVIKIIDNHSVEPWICKIKGNINSKKEKIYHMIWCKSYNKTKITPAKWERFFCTQDEAKKAGWRMAWNCN